MLDLLFEGREAAGAALVVISYDERLVGRFAERRLVGGWLKAAGG